MRRMQILIVVVVMLCAQATLGAVTVLNGSFESGKLGWEFKDNATNWIVLDDSSNAKTGFYCLRGTQSDTVHNMYPATMAQNLNGTLVSGRHYQITFWLKANYSQPAAQTAFPIHEGQLLIDGKVIATTGPIQEAAVYNGIWNYYRLTYQARAEDAGKRLRFELKFNANGATQFMHVLDGVGASESDAATTFQNRAITPVSRQAEAWWVQRMDAINARVRQGDVDMLFIGDSITQGWETAAPGVWNQYYGSRKALNLGFSGDQTQNVLWRLSHGNIDGLSPKLAVILIGVNNTREAIPAQDTVAGIDAILKALRLRLPQTRILLLGIFPCGQTSANADRRQDELINYQIRNLADGKMIHYLDMGQLFLGADGSLSSEIMGDYLHPSLKGYKIWAEAMEPKVVELLNDADKAPVDLAWFNVQ